MIASQIALGRALKDLEVIAPPGEVCRRSCFADIVIANHVP